MNNPDLAEDYKKRARGRRKVLDALFKEKLYADVVRESQEACELALKSLIREAGHAVPFHHDVSAKLQEIASDLSVRAQGNLTRLCEISRTLRRDREIAFYGSEDITPSEFYTEKDAKTAIAMVDEVLAVL